MQRNFSRFFLNDERQYTIVVYMNMYIANLVEKMTMICSGKSLNIENY